MKTYVCSICGYVHTGTGVPATCKKCGAASTHFVLKEKSKITYSPKKIHSAVNIEINGILHKFIIGHDIESSETLSHLLREKLGLTGIKVACDEGACGACTVLFDNKAVLSCMILAVEANGHKITTVEGLKEDDPVITAFAEQSEPGFGTAMQCGYCTPGFVMAAKSLLHENPDPNLEEIKLGLSGNLCRCGCYPAAARAVEKIVEQENNS